MPRPTLLSAKRSGQATPSNVTAPSTTGSSIGALVGRGYKTTNNAQGLSNVPSMQATGLGISAVPVQMAQRPAANRGLPPIGSFRVRNASHGRPAIR